MSDCQEDTMSQEWDYCYDCDRVHGPDDELHQQVIEDYWAAARKAEADRITRRGKR